MSETLGRHPDRDGRTPSGEEASAKVGSNFHKNLQAAIVGLLTGNSFPWTVEFSCDNPDVYNCFVSKVS